MLAVTEHCGISAGSHLSLTVCFIKGRIFYDAALFWLIHWTQVFASERIDAILVNRVCHLLEQFRIALSDVHFSCERGVVKIEPDGVLQECVMTVIGPAD